MGKFFKFSTLSLVLLMFISNFSYVYGENNYQVLDIVDGEYEAIDSFEEYEKALRFYDQHLDDYDNLTLIEDDKVLDTEYGVISFLNKDNEDIEYYSLNNGKEKLNGAFVGEAAYLYSDNDLVYFKVAGDIGYILKDEVEIIPYDLVNNELSIYLTDDNYLRHLLKVDLNNKFYNYDLKLDEIPYGLNKNSKYYSYDGHYFYDDYKIMIDDYKNGVYDNAANSEAAYYNYYKYLPYRSFTNYSYEEINDYFINELCLDRKILAYDDLNRDGANDEVNLSQLYGEIDSFFSNEEIYGTNAMLLLTSALHESSYGKSLKAFVSNSLYTHDVFDSEEERSSQRYTSISNCVYAHAKYYVSKLYCGIRSNVYHGSFLGDKSSGMNVNYSGDPYWAEKVSSIYFNLDEKLGYKDRNNYALGIIKDQQVIRIYRDENLSDKYYELSNVDDFSLILLEELDDVYKIQTDLANLENYKYNPAEAVGYIDKDEIAYIVNEEEIKEPEYKEAYFDFNEGKLGSEYSVSVIVPSDKEVVMSKANKEGYEFVSFSDVGIAEYKKISEIKVIKDINKVIYENETYDLKGGVLKVTYEDGSYKNVDIDTNMIYGFNSNEVGDISIIIEYCGVKLEYPLSIKESLEEEIEGMLVSNINSYKESGTYNQEELEYIKKNLSKTNYPISFDDIRLLDTMLLDTSRVNLNYNFKDNEHDLSISGLALSLSDPKAISIFKPFKDTYYIELNIVDISDIRIEKMAKAYDFKIVDSFNINVDYNLQNATFINPIVVSIKLDNKETNKIYTVYHLDESGNIIKCLAKQSNNYLSFMSKSEGDFIILSKDSVNSFEFDDYYENISIANSDPDNHLLFIEGGVMMIVSILGFIMIVSHHILNKKEEKIWNDYKKYLQEAESVRAGKLKN